MDINSEEFSMRKLIHTLDVLESQNLVLAASSQLYQFGNL